MTMWMIARSMAIYVEQNDDTLQPSEAYDEETRDEITATLHNAVVQMTNRRCATESEINLTSGAIDDLENGNYIKPCDRGWALTHPWTETIERQAPPPTLNWHLYRQKMDPEFVP